MGSGLPLSRPHPRPPVRRQSGKPALHTCMATGGGHRTQAPNKGGRVHVTPEGGRWTRNYQW